MVEIQMPEMGESVTEGTILEWHKHEGDFVEQGETVVEVSTDKVDAEIPAPASGTITKLVGAVDDVVSVGAVLAELEAGAPPSDNGGPSTTAKAAETAEPAEASGAPEAPGSSAAQDAGEGLESADATIGEARSSPLARRAAAARGIDLGAVAGSGAGGKITKADVLAAPQDGDGASPQPGAARTSGAGEATTLRGPAGMLARAMDESLATPTATSFRTISVDVLDAKRKALNAALAERGTKISFTHLIAWAIALAGREWPVMARSFEQRDGKPHALEASAVNLGLAVDVERKDGSRGLMVPCITDTNALEFSAFHSRYEELVTKTRENTLTPDDLQGTNITLTNPGGLGTVASVPRLTMGGTIIATGSIAYPAEWAHADAERVRELGISKVMTMTSTYDHRVIQGAESGSFLGRIDELLQGSDGFYETVAEALQVSADSISSAVPASAGAPGGATAAAQGTAAVNEAGTAPGPAAPGAESARPDEELLQAVQAATSLLKAYRTHGHLAAHLDPLGSEPKGDPALEPENLNLTPELMRQIPASILRIGVPGETLLEALPRMREVYCGAIGYQIEHLSSHKQRMWLRDMIETDSHRSALSDEERRQLLWRLINVSEFERFLQKAYIGQKTFSIEGLDAVVPMIDELAGIAAGYGAQEVVIGMAHRGRLSTLAHNLGRPLESIFAEFEGAKALEAVQRVAAIRHGGTGDVKYHHGTEGEHHFDGGQISIRLYPNPSHLEYVDPVVTGAARAEQTEIDGAELKHNPQTALALLLHGDAAFPAQGVVAETFNLQSLEGYATGGTVHIITNNQIGFTTDPRQARSTPYAADMAKGFNVPILHVNADDLEACIATIRLAMAYRQEWARDVVVDLIGYRRYGHNELDEPAYTQPAMAATIKTHPPVSEIYAAELLEGGVITDQELADATGARREELAKIHADLRARIAAGELGDEAQTGTGELDRSKSPDVETAVPPDRLRTLNAELLSIPERFSVHRKLKKPLLGRLEALEDGPIDFGHAEALAFASLLEEGTHIRLTGQDTERGTFSHRHMVLHDEQTGERYTPIQNLPSSRAPLEIHNTPLSENACLGFEYGYSAASPSCLVLWEAQFGDFANAAQVIIDSFIASGEAKWGQRTRLTLLLPHGYDGSGPEHSSARIMRFIALAAEGNMRLANPSTAAQYFHLLRRQALITKPRPLVVFTPKGLLRLPAAASTLADLTDAAFEYVLDDPRAGERRDQIKRLVLCSGKLYYDLDSHERREDADAVAIARVELLYPFARNEIADLIARYPHIEEIVWAQEEPQNMGAWKVTSQRMAELVPDGVEFRYVGRPSRAATSEGYPAAHRAEQERIVLTALVG